MTRLNRTARVGGREHVVVVQALAAIPWSALGKACGSLRARRNGVIVALDHLFTGI